MHPTLCEQAKGNIISGSENQLTESLVHLQREQIFCIQFYFSELVNFRCPSSVKGNIEGTMSWRDEMILYNTELQHLDRRDSVSRVFSAGTQLK